MDNRLIRDPGYIDAEWREVPDEPSPLVQPCPHCGKDFAPAFGQCYHCFGFRREGFWCSCWRHLMANLRRDGWMR